MASLRTVRWVLVGGALLLVMVVAGFVGYARYRAKVYLSGLPGRLGLHITQESDNVTYSQSVKGRTIYTVHAAKQIQHEGGRYTLRDVGIALYGAKGDREDRIHGNEFEWDQKEGVMRAVGEVFLDLDAPSGGAVRDDPEKRRVHVKTSGLVFRQKEKSAATEEEVEFQTGAMSGRSKGASYDSGSGVVVLRSAVRMNGLRGGRPMTVTAGRAEMDRVGSVVKLEGTKVVEGTNGGERTGAAERAVVHLTAEGAPTSVEAEGAVTLTGDGRGGARGTVTAGRLEAELNGAGQLRTAHLLGGVRFLEVSAAKQERGAGAEARVSFDGEGRARAAVLTGGADLEETMGANSRRLEAAQVEMALAGGGKEPVEVTGARATGGARLRSVDANAKEKGGKTATGVRAEVLTARFAGGGKARGGAGLASLDGAGKTWVEQVVTDAKDRVESTETSAGDSLRMEFGAGAGAGMGGRSELVRAEQRGTVTVVREARAKGDVKVGSETRSPAPVVEHARGERAVYDRTADRLTMTGEVEVSGAESELFAAEVVTDRGSGETTAAGGVRVSYAEAGGEPVHVVAGRAVSHKVTGKTEFFAAGGAKAKMWQGGSQVEAPVLELDRAKKVMVARDPAGAEEAVRAVLVDASGRPGKATGGPVRVWSREMVYRDAAREVELRGRVRVEDQEGTMRAGGATVYLAPAAAPAQTHGVSAELGGVSTVSLGGKVERMVGMGGVEMVQPGRVATGERLVYTAGDRTFVLTGTRAVPPKMVDEAKGTTTGAALRFTSGEDRVEVSGAEAGDARRVRSETKVR